MERTILGLTATVLGLVMKRKLLIIVGAVIGLRTIMSSIPDLGGLLRAIMMLPLRFTMNFKRRSLTPYHSRMPGGVASSRTCLALRWDFCLSWLIVK
jgi:hypothetical protein